MRATMPALCTSLSSRLEHVRWKENCILICCTTMSKCARHCTATTQRQLHHFQGHDNNICYTIKYTQGTSVLTAPNMST